MKDAVDQTQYTTFKTNEACLQFEETDVVGLS